MGRNKTMHMHMASMRVTRQWSISTSTITCTAAPRVWHFSAFHYVCPRCKKLRSACKERSCCCSAFYWVAYKRIRSNFNMTACIRSRCMSLKLDMVRLNQRIKRGHSLQAKIGLWHHSYSARLFCARPSNCRPQGAHDNYETTGSSDAEEESHKYYLYI